MTEQNSDIAPWLYQERVAQRVVAGENVLIQTPTGSGKTRAALEPFLVNLMRDKDHAQVLPRTCRYAVPLRTLANQFHNEYKHIIGDLGKSSLADIERAYGRYGVELVAQQTGEQPNDPLFESVLTFCTIDQLLAAFLGIPYSVSQRQTNLKVAGIAASYIVLDEWHLFPLRTIDGNDSQWDMKGARATSLAMLRLLKDQNLARFVLMTATLSTRLVTQLAQLLGATVENLRQGAKRGETEDQAFARELRQITGDRSRTWRRTSRTLFDSVNDILDLHEEVRRERDGCATLVVCNTVERAQQVYLRIKEASRLRSMKAPDLLLHARFTDTRRRQQGQIVERLLGAAAWEHVAQRPDAIVVATQVVEVGLNISADLLHSELAPANSLIQRAGRCARFQKQHGAVTIYEPPKTRMPSAPYRAALCDSTRDVLPETPTKVTFAGEQAFIDHVHSDEDQKFLDRFEDAEEEFRSRIFAGWRSKDELGSAAALIRDIQQVQIIIHDNPREIKTEPWRYQAFSLHPGLLRGRWDWLQQRSSDLGLDWVLKQAEITGEQPKQPGEEEDGRAPLQCTWADVPESAVKAGLTGAIVSALPSALAFYDDEIGFAFRDSARLGDLPGDRYQSEQLKRTRNKRHSSSIIERRTYLQHISGLLRAYQFVLCDELLWPARQLEESLGYEHGTIDKAARIILAYHDLGKLTEEWQGWARAWLTKLHAKHPDQYDPAPSVLLAKTDFDYRYGSDHRELQRGLKPPRHAVEGMALASRALVAAVRSIAPPDADQDDVLLGAMRTAIAHHHTTDAHEAGDRSLAAGAVDALQAAIAQTCGNTSWSDQLCSVSPPVRIAAGEKQPYFMAIDLASNHAGVWLYFLLVRILRLSDQRAESGGR